MTTRLTVVRPADRVPDAASGAMLREAGVSRRTTGAQHLWVGFVELPAGLVSSVHHHGSSESAIYVISGSARFCAGEGLADVEDASAGDFVFVPPNVVHVEMNLSDDGPVRMVVARSTQDAIVVNVDPPAGWSAPR